MMHGNEDGRHDESIAEPDGPANRGMVRSFQAQVGVPRSLTLALGLQMKLLLLATTVAVMAGCAAVESTPSVPADSRPDLAAFIRRADVVAQNVLDQHNSEVRVRSERERDRLDPIGEYSLSDYERHVAEAVDPDGRAYIDVSYRLTTPRGFRGHPSHFNVWVDWMSDEIRVFKGR